MTGHTHLLIVEGRLDRKFLTCLLPFALSENCATRFKILTSKELPGGHGGKPVLLRYYDYLRRRHALVSTLDHRRTTVGFFLDKDVDDIKRRLRRSPHVIYTDHYEIENYLFLHGDIVTATCTATALDRSVVEPAFFDSDGSWTRRCAKRWVEWLAICLLEVQLGSVGPNYHAKSSPVHDSNGVVDEARLNQRLSDMRKRTAYSQDKFQELLNLARKRVASLISADAHDRIFKGKWYAWFLERDVRRHCVNHDAYFEDLGAIATRFLVTTLDFNGAWTSRIRDRIRALASL